jgi:hypothetical protein
MFEERLEFDITLIPYDGNDSWLEKTIKNIHSCLMNNQIPGANEDCDYCAYRAAVEDVL